MDVDQIKDLEKDLLTCLVICGKCVSDSYAQNLYAALCNTTWQAIEVISILKSETWGCSWRHSGSIVAQIRNGVTPGAADETYIDWYCSGMAVDADMLDDCADMFKTSYDHINSSHVSEYVGEGTVTDEIREDLKNLGWQEVKDTDENE